MYEIRPETIITFINDKNVRFPRFQRKQTWKDEQNLKLAISIFKNYPVGVTIINKEDYKSRVTKWLLDGRQRRNALKLMLDNPENIYTWAKNFFKIKDNDQEQEIVDKFWNGIDDYLNFRDQWELDESDEDINEIKNEIKNDNEELDEQIESTIHYNLKDNKYLGNLHELLKIILTVHKQTTTYTSYSKPFDFSSIIQNLPYIEKNGKKSIIDGKKLTTFINQYTKFLSDSDYSPIASLDTFERFVLSRYQLNEIEESKFSKELEKNWEYIFKSIEVVEIIENRLQESKIGIIETTNLSPTDSQMIFKLINDEGTPLSAVEILSAKPSWNIEIKNPSTKLKRYAEELYKAIKTDSTNIVRWDYPATIYNRLDDFTVILPEMSYEKKLEKNITLGFKIISGIFQKAIKKEDLSSLASNTNINWEEDIDELVNDLCQMGKVLSESNYFKCLKSWNSSFMHITSDAITLNFIFIMYEDYMRKGKPIGRGSKVFVNNAVKLADRLMYEYISKKWRGSSDSKISQNLKAFVTSPEIFDSISDDAWKKLLKDIIDNAKIEDDNIKFNLMKSLVYHQYSIAEIMGPNDTTIKVDIDHIIPKSLFSKEDAMKDSLFNLCPLPQKDNQKKTDMKLNMVHDKWLIQQIEKYSHIKNVDFNKFSTPQDINDLRNYRRSFFEKDFLRNRNDIFNS